jgi:outer membrane protein insertion porin family
MGPTDLPPETITMRAVVVRETLQSFGYFHASVPAPTMAIMDFSRHPQPISLNVAMAEGKQYKVMQVTWSGVRAISDEQFRSISQIRPDDILDMSKVRETTEALRRLYASIGYPHASIVARVQDEVGHRVSLAFRIVEGVQTP